MINLLFAAILLFSFTQAKAWDSYRNVPMPVEISVSQSGKTLVMKTGTLVTASQTVDQVILTYTVTVGKTFYLEYLVTNARTTANPGSNASLGTLSLEIPSGSKGITTTNINPSDLSLPFGEPLPIMSGTVVRVVCTPAANTSMTWVANLGGYEK